MNRTATFWNNLPVKIVNAKSVYCFKDALDKHLEHINWKTHTRIQLEFASSVWNPNRKRNIDTLEKVQRRATKTIESFIIIYLMRKE